MRRFALAATLLLAGTVLAGCGPEAARTRGSGAGADLGNRGENVVLFNEDNRNASIYFETPDDLPKVAAGEPLVEPTAAPAASPAS